MLRPCRAQPAAGPCLVSGGGHAPPPPPLGWWGAGSAGEEVEARRRRNEAVARPAVRSPWLATYGGLGFQQARLGETLFEVLKYDADDAVRRLLAPGGWRLRLAAPALVAAVLAFVRLAAWLLGAAAASPAAKGPTGEDGAPGGGGGGTTVVGSREFASVGVVLVLLAAGGGLLMPVSPVRGAQAALLAGGGASLAGFLVCGGAAAQWSPSLAPSPCRLVLLPPSSLTVPTPLVTLPPPPAAGRRAASRRRSGTSGTAPRCTWLRAQGPGAACASSSPRAQPSQGGCTALRASPPGPPLGPPLGPPRDRLAPLGSSPSRRRLGVGPTRWGARAERWGRSWTRKTGTFGRRSTMPPRRARAGALVGKRLWTLRRCVRLTCRQGAAGGCRGRLFLVRLPPFRRTSPRRAKLGHHLRVRLECGGNVSSCAALGRSTFRRIAL